MIMSLIPWEGHSFLRSIPSVMLKEDAGNTEISNQFSNSNEFIILISYLVNTNKFF